ncbi:hypothetical protein K438DRAFT_1771021 [Mycena galopus ATCC 62051]|nr:hypothetical protein K438DRAFT_1771021 [Mycena galopus ATCC 62051]
MSKAITTPQMRPATATTVQQRLLTSPMGIFMSKLGHDIGDLQGLFSPVELSAVADALADENNPIYAELSFFQSGEPNDIMRMPHEGPEVAKIKLHIIPTTRFAIRQYSLPIGSGPCERDRQAFIFDFYDVEGTRQLSKVPKGYDFRAVSLKTGSVGKNAVADWDEEITMDTVMDAHMQMQSVVLGPYGTIIAVRGVQFEVKLGPRCCSSLLLMISLQKC